MGVFNIAWIENKNGMYSSSYGLHRVQTRTIARQPHVGSFQKIKTIVAKNQVGIGKLQGI